MSGYMTSQTGSEPSVPVAPMEVVDLTFEGYHVRIARRPGSRMFIFADDVSEGIGSDMNVYMQSQHVRLTTVGLVRLNGVSQSVRLIASSDFYWLCQLNPSPRLDAFRKRVAEILEQIQETGRYSDPNFGGNGVSQSDPFMESLRESRQNLDRIQVVYQRLGEVGLTAERADRRSIEAEVKLASTQKELEDLRTEIGRGKNGPWTIAAWFDFKGLKCSADVINQEGCKCGNIARRMGIVMPKDKRVCSGGPFAAHKWPMVVINEWWLDFQRRYPELFR